MIVDDDGNGAGPSILVKRDFPRPVEPDEPTAVALEVLQEADLPFLPVRGKESGRCVGVVLKKALVNGCRGMGHDIERCPISKHLYTDIQQVKASGADAEGWDLEKAEGRPTVVVDSDGIPLRIVVPTTNRSLRSDGETNPPDPG